MAAFFTSSRIQSGAVNLLPEQNVSGSSSISRLQIQERIYKSMSNLISRQFGSKNSLLNGSIGLIILLLIVGGCTGKGDSRSNANNGPATDSKASDMPDDAVLKANVKLTTAQFANAISTEDFTTLRDNASDEFKEKYTAEQAKGVFADAVRNKRSLLPMLASLVNMDPEFSEPPSLRREGKVPVVTVKGRYATKPKPLEFEYEYVYLFGKMKLLKLILK